MSRWKTIIIDLCNDPVSEMTYTVSSGTLNTTILYHTIAPTYDVPKKVCILLLANYTVRVVITGGSVLEAMAEAVEKAAVVLVCLTQKYKESPNCRTGRYMIVCC